MDPLGWPQLFIKMSAYQWRLRLDYYKIVLKHCNIGFRIIYCCLIQANLLLFILAHMVDWGSLSYHHRLQQRTVVNVSDRLCLLGVTLDNTLSFNQHVNNIVKNCNCHPQALRHIHASITDEVAKWWLVLLLALELITVTHYFTEWLTRTWISLQRVQNRTARIFCCTGSQHISSTLQLHHLHWLPVRSRIQFKLSTLCFRSRMLNQPTIKTTTRGKRRRGLGLGKLPNIWGTPLIFLQRPRCPLSVSGASCCNICTLLSDFRYLIYKLILYKQTNLYIEIKDSMKFLDPLMRPTPI